MSNLKYRRDIDGLRAVAILPVLLFHAGISGFSGGFVGVDIFFVISGYLITSIIVREVTEGSFTYKDFWARRARRILPASVVMIIACLAAGWFLLAPNDYYDLGRSAREQAYFAANFFFWQESGYFDGPSELKPLLHMWSLAVEEQFYVVFPLIFLLAHKFIPRFKFLLLIAIFIASLTASILLIESSPSATFYLLHTRACELLIGSLLAVAPVMTKKHNIVYELVSLISLAVITFCVVSYNEHTVFPGAAALLPTLATAAIIWANSYHNTLAKRFLSIQPMVWFGLISYSLYLWHWPLMAFTRYNAVEELLLIDKLMLVIASIALGYLSWRFIETPFRLRQLLATDKKILWAALAALIVIAIIGQQIRRTEGYPPRLPENARNFAIASEWEKYQKKCYKLKPEQVAAGEICRFGDEDQTKPELFFWGDSHAAAYLPAIKSKTEQHGILTLHASKSGCPTLLGGERPNDPSCAAFNKSMLKNLHNSGTKNVLLASRWSAYVYGEYENSNVAMLYSGSDKDKSVAEAKQIFSAHLTQLVTDLRAQGFSVWLAKQVPLQTVGEMYHELTIRAMKNLDTSSIGISLAQHSERQAFANSVLDGLAGEGVVILDPTSMLCVDDFCPAQRNGFSMYKDDNHLSVQGAESVQELFEPMFQSITETPKNNQ